jgi:hypothetical protein
MKEITQKGEQFLHRWEERRKKKWLYIFLHGSVYYGLPLAIILFLMVSEFKIENMQVSALLIFMAVFVLGGLLSGLRQYNMVDSIYLKLIDNDDVVKGLETLKAGETWNHENLVIHSGNDGNLVVRNELFWFEEGDTSPAKLNDCFNMVLADFQRLQKDQGFNDFTTGKKVKIQIFDNSGSDVPLIEKII